MNTRKDTLKGHETFMPGLLFHNLFLMLYYILNIFPIQHIQTHIIITDAADPPIV